MASIKNPRKVFNFSLTFPGYPIDPFLFQEVVLPDIEIETVEHGDTNYDVKTGGRVKIGKLVLRKLFRSEKAGSTYFWDWMVQVQDAATGGGLTPDAYYRDIVVEEFAEDGLTPINKWEFFECWPGKINGQSQKRMSSENTIEEIELNVNLVTKGV